MRGREKRESEGEEGERGEREGGNRKGHDKGREEEREGEREEEGREDKKRCKGAREVAKSFLVFNNIFIEPLPYPYILLPEPLNSLLGTWPPGQVGDRQPHRTHLHW